MESYIRYVVEFFSEKESKWILVYSSYNEASAYQEYVLETEFAKKQQLRSFFRLRKESVSNIVLYEFSSENCGGEQ